MRLPRVRRYLPVGKNIFRAAGPLGQGARLRWKKNFVQTSGQFKEVQKIWTWKPIFKGEIPGSVWITNHG
jgi:hypothetical protein